MLPHHFHPKSTVYVSFHQGIVYSLGFDKYIMAYIHHYDTTQNSFTALKSFVFQLSITHFSNIYTFTVSLVEPFHFFLVVTRKILFIYFFLQNVYLFKSCYYSKLYCPKMSHSWNHIVFSDWLLTLSNLHLSFLHVLSQLISLQLWIIFYCLNAPQFIYPFTYWWTSWLLSDLSNYE